MRPSWSSLALLAASSALFLSPFACATAITQGPSGTGGSASSATTGGHGGSGGAAQTTGTGGSGGCVVASDCIGSTDACNTGACINGVCGKLPANELSACDDGVNCTDNTVCMAGQCTGGTLKFCPGADSCHVGTCDAMLDTCVQSPGNDGASCSDDDACTLTGTCSGGTCIPGGMVDCSFLNGTCSLGVCDPQLGCKIMPLADGASCDDQKYCTVNDTCQQGQCTGVPNTCGPVGDVCHIGMCDEGTHSCISVPGNEGMSCEDGNPCTAGEKCSNGSCLGGLPANDGIACDDNDGCTAGTTCAGGTCTNATSQILQCIDNDSCCPAGCVADNDCLYWASGVQQNVPDATLVGWSKCYSGNYNDNSGNVSQLLQTCNKAKLLMACRPVGTQTWTLLAMAPRADVTFDCGMQNSCTQQSNGVGWYFSDSYSWGFAPGGDTVNRNSCDYNLGNQVDADKRLCWHTSGQNINTGYRCGSNALNFDATWERAVFHAD